MWYSLQLLDFLMLWHLQHIDQFFLICSSANMRLVCEDSWTHRLLLFFRQSSLFLTLQIHSWRTGVNPCLCYPICVLFFVLNIWCFLQVHIQSKKIDLSHVTSKCGSLDNIRHRPGEHANEFWKFLPQIGNLQCHGTDWV